MTKLTQSLKIIGVISLAGLILAGCQPVDQIKQKLTGQNPGQDINPAYQQETQVQPVAPSPEEVNEAQPTIDEATDPADQIDQAMKNLDTLPTEGAISDQ